MLKWCRSGSNYSCNRRVFDILSLMTGSDVIRTTSRLGESTQVVDIMMKVAMTLPEFQNMDDQKGEKVAMW